MVRTAQTTKDIGNIHHSKDVTRMVILFIKQEKTLQHTHTMR